tara:strand:+ start:18144 stop:18569 length:426 start_codon:yes stop_codon:yes gene_type:complete
MSIYIQDYSEKSFVLRGDTKPHKEKIKDLGGKWTSNLTDKSSGEKFAGWIFYMPKKAEIEKWLNTNITTNHNQHNERETVLEKADKMEIMLVELITMIKDNNLIKSDVLDSTDVGRWYNNYVGSDDDDDDDVGKIRPRLLG